MDEQRAGEKRLAISPADMAGDAHLVFIGRIGTSWETKGQCPKNGRQSADICEVELFEAFRDGLESIESCTHLFLLYWMHKARRDLIVQAPSFDNSLHGCFATRSPVRPNPVSLSAVELLGVDRQAGRLQVRGLDCLNGTPLIDIKPYFGRTDCIPDAKVGWHERCSGAS